jgi:hypothetical protein
MINKPHVFWSGGIQAKNAAEAFARANGGQTLEMTMYGNFLDKITNRATYPYLKPLWNRASMNFARGAEGTVNVFQSGRGVRIESIWHQVEYPELMQQGNIIYYHIIP